MPLQRVPSIVAEMVRADVPGLGGGGGAPPDPLSGTLNTPLVMTRLPVAGPPTLGATVTVNVPETMEELRLLMVIVPDPTPGPANQFCAVPFSASAAS